MKKNVALAIALTFVMSSASAADMTEHQKVLYAIGQVLADQVGVFALTPDELKSVQQGLHDGVTGAKSAVDMSVYGPKIKPLADERTAAAAKNAAGRSGSNFVALSMSHGKIPINAAAISPAGRPNRCEAHR